MSFETWLLFMLVALAPAASPGPGILFAITTALRYGRRAALLTGLANGGGLVLLCLAVGLGLGALMAASMLAFTALKIAGALYLIWLGVKIWREPWMIADADAARIAAPPYGRLMRRAFVIALTNPKAMVLIAALTPPFMDPGAAAAPQVALMAVSYGALCSAIHAAIACAGGWFRRWLSRPRWASRFRRISGGAFVGFGVALGASDRVG